MKLDQRYTDTRSNETREINAKQQFFGSDMPKTELSGRIVLYFVQMTHTEKESKIMK
jgi:hypothetical protein